MAYARGVGVELAPAAEFVTAADIAGPGILFGESVGGHDVAKSLLADQNDALMLIADHGQDLVDERIGRVLRDLDLNFRCGQMQLRRLIQNEVRDMIDLRRPVRLRTAQIDRLPPIVVDGAPLHEEVVEEFPHLFVGERAVGEIAVVERSQHPVQVAQ